MPRERSEVSLCVKYLLFFFNVFFWLIGGLMISIGLYARFEKTAYQEFFSDVLTDPAFALIIVGAIMFILGFSGCIGALRENICLLKFFSIFLAIIFFLQLSLGVAAFVFQDKVEEVIVDKLQVAIKKYRDNYDLQNLIDGVQQEFKCCGGKDVDDWDQNIYFNCSSPGSESCGVPFSCCKEDIINRQCGYKIRLEKSTSKRGQVIYTTVCVEAVKTWFKENMIIIGGAAVGVALLQIMGICFANSLMSDIKMQKAKWNRDYPH
ncbi:tetraspanin-17-like [Actinia tenebrosa]|uniref:Tetraspanin n=1 Tax=Actinia tenebrosa TaxID=6105 RepID=A0A6P8IK14_ACTTE|nr:tetraspanin-17-like [Actinia tenebrosa]